MSEDGTGRGTPLVHVAFNGKASAHRSMNPSVVAPSMEVGKSDGICVAFAENSRAEVRLENGDGGITGALKSGGGKAGQSYPVAAIGHNRSAVWRVRRLMPVECERLQGFPDGWTDVPYRGKPAADGPRYKALGNSMACNVMRWIGRRIELVERLCDAA